MYKHTSLLTRDVHSNRMRPETALRFAFGKIGDHLEDTDALPREMCTEKVPSWFRRVGDRTPAVGAVRHTPSAARAAQHFSEWNERLRERHEYERSKVSVAQHQFSWRLRKRLKELLDSTRRNYYGCWVGPHGTTRGAQRTDICEVSFELDQGVGVEHCIKRVSPKVLQVPWDEFHALERRGVAAQQIREDGRRCVTAAGMIYRWKVGPIPAGTKVMRICNNPLCLNPEHLTSWENVCSLGGRTTSRRILNTVIKNKLTNIKKLILTPEKEPSHKPFKRFVALMSKMSGLPPATVGTILGVPVSVEGVGRCVFRTSSDRVIFFGETEYVKLPPSLYTGAEVDENGEFIDEDAGEE